MLTLEDLKSIRTIVGEEIESKVPPLLKAGLDDLEMRMDVKFDAVHESLQDMEERIDLKFDAVQESLEANENKLVTKSYLDDKLSNYVKRQM